MKPTDLLAPAILKTNEPPELPAVQPVMNICAVTGEETLCYPRKELFGKSFTDASLFAAPLSEWIGVNAYIAVKYRPTRASSWFCDGETFTRLNRKGVRDYALNPDMPPVWAGYATTSYKKHGSLKAFVNRSGSRIWLFETRYADMSDFGKVTEWWNVLNEYLKSGIGRQSLETLEASAFLIQQLGMKRWLEFHEWALPKWKSPLYSFLCYLLPSQEELKEKANAE